jgi:hypothetical protein
MNYSIRENAELSIKVITVTNTSSAAKTHETPPQLFPERSLTNSYNYK